MKAQKPHPQTSDPSPAPVLPPRVTIGRTVSFVLNDGQVRPMIVVRAWIGDYINGVLFFDGSNDARLLPEQAHNPHPNPAGMPYMWMTSVQHDEDRKPGTWHWPARV